MSAVFTIARAETRRIFVSPLAWTVLAIFEVVVGLAYAGALQSFSYNAMMGGEQAVGISDYLSSSVYGFASVVALFIMPLMTMRSFAEERKAQSLILLFSAPVSLIEIVLGKFLAIFLFILSAAALLAAMAGALAMDGSLDYGKLGAGLLGFILMLSAFSATGLFASTVTREPTIAAVLGFGIALAVWISSMFASSPGLVGQLVGYLSLITHFESLGRGVFNSADVIYYFLFTAFFLWLAVLRLDVERN